MKCSFCGAEYDKAFDYELFIGTKMLHFCPECYKQSQREVNFIETYRKNKKFEAIKKYM